MDPSFANWLTFVAYNVVWWIPVVLPFTKIIDYRTGFIAFFVVTVIRAGANLYRNNVLTLEQAANGASFAAICEGLLEWIDAEQVALVAAALLKQWIGDQMVAEVHNLQS